MSGKSLLSLPCELVWHIIEDLSSEHALNVLSQANRRFYEAMTPYRYQYNARYHNASALIWAAINGQVAVAAKSLQHGAYATGRIVEDESGNTPLSLASKYGHEETVKLLLATVKPDQTGTGTSLRKAAKHGQVDVVKLLLAWKGFQPSDIEHWGGLALMSAIRYRKEEVIKALLADGRIDPNYLEDDDMTPLWAATCEEDTSIMKLLLQDRRVEANSRFSYGRICLTGSIQSNWHASVDVLLNHPAIDVNFPEGWGMTPLLVAVITRQQDAVKRLLARDEVQLDIKDRDGDAPLSLAVKRGYTEIAELL